MKHRISTFITAIIFLLLGVTTATAQGTKAYFNKGGETVFEAKISDIDSIVFKPLANSEDKTVSIDGVISVHFPENSISTNDLKVQKLEDSDIQDIFEITSIFYQVKKQSDYQIKIDLGSNEPIYENPIEIVANIPPNFTADDLSDDIQLFVLMYQQAEDEIIDHFEVITSGVNFENKTITAILPYWVFTNERNGNYETYLVVASLEKENSLRSSIKTTKCFMQTICPISTCEVTSSFNLNRLLNGETSPHYGIDFKASIGTPVYAIAAGTVNWIGTDIRIDKKGRTKGWGTYVMVEHQNPHSISLYAHLSDVLVKKGDSIQQGQEIAKSGNSGGGTGAHLHLEVRSFDMKTVADQEPCINLLVISISNITSNSATATVTIDPAKMIDNYQDKGTPVGVGYCISTDKNFGTYSNGGTTFNLSQNTYTFNCNNQLTCNNNQFLESETTYYIYGWVKFSKYGKNDYVEGDKTFSFKTKGLNCQEFDNEQGVVINGVRWATRNVGAPGTFASSPCDPGMLYQWNRKTAWPATGTGAVVTGWDTSIPTGGGTWEKANDPSPSGWRIPTSVEIATLLDADKVASQWVTQNGVIGGKFTDIVTGNTLFLPAVGGRNSSGTLCDAGANGGYWSSFSPVIEFDGEKTACNLNFSKYYFIVYRIPRASGLSVRAVAE